MTAIAQRLVDAPDLRGLTPLQRSQIVNWRVDGKAVAPFTVVERTAPEIEDALARGDTTSEDVVRPVRRGRAQRLRGARVPEIPRFRRERIPPARQPRSRLVQGWPRSEPEAT